MEPTNSNFNDTSKEIKELKDTQVQIVGIISKMSEKSETAHNEMLKSMQKINHQIKWITIIILIFLFNRICYLSFKILSTFKKFIKSCCLGNVNKLGNKICSLF